VAVARYVASLIGGVVTALISIPLWSIAGTAGAQAPTQPVSAAQAPTLSSYGQLPLAFIRNDGQLDSAVQYYERGAGQAIYFSADGITLALARTVESDDRVATSAVESVRLRPVAANPAPSLIAENHLPGYVNYFHGRDSAAWHTRIPMFASVSYQQIYPGIDLRFHGDNKQLEYDFVVAPGAKPEDIVMAYEGVERLTIDDNGDLIVKLTNGELVQKAPYIYQLIEGKRVEVAGAFRLINNTDNKSSAYRFELAAYDHSLPLIIDPVLSYSSFLGGSNHDLGYDVAVNAAGEAYVVGVTLSLDFPVVNAYQATTTADYSDVFITRLNAAGNALIYSTYLGGSDGDEGYAIAVDSSNNAYVTGRTSSSDFPLQGAIQSIKTPEYDDAFVAKLDPTGTMLLYSTYLGGNRDDMAQDIAVDSTGNMYIAGNTRSHDFPTQNPLYTSADTGNNKDAFVVKLNASGSAYIYSTYLGGDSEDRCTGIAVDGSGNAYVTGWTESANFPTTASAYSTTHVSEYKSVYVTKIDAAGTQLLYSTYLSGLNDDIGYGIAVDSLENAYVVGATRSHDFPTVNPLYTAADTGNNNDAFVSKIDTLSSGISSLVYSTYLGGDNRDAGFAIAVNSAGDAFVTGVTRSLNFPAIGTPFQSTNGGDHDAFIANISSDGSQLLYSSYLGGSNADEGRGIAVDTAGNAYITGYTHSPDFPTASPYQAALGSSGYTDAFITKVQ